MGFFKRKAIIQEVQPEENSCKKSDNSHALLVAAEYLKKNNDDLSAENFKTFRGIEEISGIIHEFSKENEDLINQCNNMKDTFDGIVKATDQFTKVKNDVNESVDTAQKQVTELKKSTNTVTERFEQMNITFQELLTTVDKIRSSTNGIKSIANQTNLLALNASIEAARAKKAC